MSISGFAQDVNFEIVTGTQKYDDAKCIIQTLDSGYVVVGSTSAFGNGQSDIYLTKLSKTGSVTWQQAIGGAGVDIGNSVIQTPDSGFAIAGYSNSAGTSGYDVYLAKTDKDGFLEWSNNYGGFDWDFGNSIIQTSAGDYVISGNTYSYGNGGSDVYLLKTDPTGVLLWDSAYGGSLEDIGKSVSEAADGGYFITGYTKSFGQGEEDVYLLKADPMGNLKWAKTYGGTAEDIGSEGKLTKDGGFIVASYTKSFFSGNYYQNWFIKTDSSGDQLWSRKDSTSYNRIVTSVCQTFDSGYIFTGYDDHLGQDNYFLFKTNSDGYYYATWCYRSYGGTDLENAFSVKQTYDSGFVAVGITESYGTGKPNIYVLKTDDTLHSTGIIAIVVGMEENELTQATISLYPNPASDHFMINAEEKSGLEIFDTMGEMVSASTIAGGNNSISIADLPDGIYFIWIWNEKYSASGKIIVRH